jgi:hypothetical protein
MSGQDSCLALSRQHFNRWCCTAAKARVVFWLPQKWMKDRGPAWHQVRICRFKATRFSSLTFYAKETTDTLNAFGFLESKQKRVRDHFGTLKITQRRMQAYIELGADLLRTCSGCMYYELWHIQTSMCKVKHRSPTI